ncbi:hypothetical protein [Acidaminobacter hydrogenoformans]|uniref:Carrier domain-containing protein n=1 Tax=Acidaminobacter hydrogenoformans DSM 2784 TaxID=1120920 RepID=A0A1G5RPZ2_9FIRM|nr:hypothetical protein [Acidaminobacter hydrogenoformans]SCZ76064.1 hypothetical protein SAMN03080599_00050 [Acidaminobacter hydrogenoformans DSM 2784]
MEERVKEIIAEAFEELNAQMDADDQILFDEDLNLIGSKGILDSLSFVTLIAIIEDLISEHLDKSIIIVNDKAFSQDRSPFHSVSSLTHYITDLLMEEG